MATEEAKKTSVRLTSPGGFTLIETVMVIIILGVIGTGILMYFMGIKEKNPVFYTQASALAEEKMERVLADKKASGFNSVTAEPPAALAAPFDRFTREVQVYCVQEADLDSSNGTMPNCNDSDIKAKHVKVKVSWSGGSIDFDAVITNH